MPFKWLYIKSYTASGRLAQVGERYPRTVEAAGSNPAPSIGWAISSGGERSPHKGEVGGSNPPSPTRNCLCVSVKRKILYTSFAYFICICR